METENRRLNDIQVQMKRLALIGIAACLCLGACERRELTYYMESEITVTADWSMAGMEEEREYGATLIAYPKDGGAPKVVLMGNRTGITFRLPRGEYDMILFNRSFHDFSAIAFRGENALGTLEAYAKETDTRTGTRVIVSSPEKLATAVVRDFKVTEDMLGNYAPASARSASTLQEGACKLHFIPLPLTRKVQVRLNIRGLHNVREADCTLGGIPLSVFLADGHPGETAGRQEFTVGDPVFEPGSLTDGTLTGGLNIFGIDTEITHDIGLNTLLVDGQTVVEQELTGVTVSEEADDKGTYILNVEASTPDPLPDVKPEGGSDSGFDAEVGGWEDEKTEEIPL